MLLHSVFSCFAFCAHAIGVELVCPLGNCYTGLPQASLLQHKQIRVEVEQELNADEPDDLPKTSEDKDSPDHFIEGESIGPDEHGYIAKAREDVAREFAIAEHLKLGEGARLLQGLDPGPQEAPGKTSHLNSSRAQTGLDPGPQEAPAKTSHLNSSLAQTVQNPGEWCHDSPKTWYDSDGPHFSCGWYAATHDACRHYGGGYRNFDKTAKQACCACGGGTKKQQYYAFAHRALTTRDITQAIADGVNAIEIDVVAWWKKCDGDWRRRGCWWAQHDGLCNIGGGDLDCFGGGAAGDRLDTMLKAIRDYGRGKIGAVMIDIKNPDWCDPESYYKECSVKMLKELIESILGNRVNVIYDVYGQFTGQGYKWLQRNFRPCYDSTDAELESPGYSFPEKMARTFTFGGSFAGHTSKWCDKLEQKYLESNARVAAFWTTTAPSQVVTGCGNAIILGHTLYHYSKSPDTFRWRSVVEEAKRVADQRGFEWPTSATAWC